MTLPDYHGRGIVNLMVSLTETLGGVTPAPYPPLRGFDTGAWRSSRSVVLFVIDGLGFRRVQRTNGVFARHLKVRLTWVFPSTTATAVTTFLTGPAPLSARLPVRMHVVSPRRIIHSDFNVAHLAELDEASGDFARRIEGTGTTVIVTADHGIRDSAPWGVHRSRCPPAPEADAALPALR